METEEGLVGRWRKFTASKCSEMYPVDLEFREGGTYQGGLGQGTQPVVFWDSGEYELLAANQVKISTANDGEIKYRFSIAHGALTFVDPDGCEFQYERVR